MTHLGPGWRVVGSASASFVDWFDGLGDRLTEVDVEGERAFVMTEHIDDLASTAPTSAVRLLPGFDQYVLGPGYQGSACDPYWAPLRREQAERLDRTGRRVERGGLRHLGSRR